MPRPVTRFFCRWVPRRTRARTFTARDAARIMCEATKDNGATEAEMVRRYREVCRGIARPRSELELAAEAAISALTNTRDALVEADALLTIALIVMGALLVLLAVLGRLIPRRILILISRNTVERLRANVQQIAVQRAANDDVIRALEQALKLAA